jgi:hypothetical protein
MDNEAPQQNNPQPPDNQQPAGQTSGQSGFGSKMRVIQPLDPSIKADSIPTQPTQQPATATPTNPAQDQATNNVTPTDGVTTEQQQPTRPDTNSIYPEATKGVSANSHSIPSPDYNKKDTVNSYNFSNGYSIGGSIFWLQLIAGIVLGLILFGIDASVLKTATISVIAIVSLLYYLVEFFVVAYIPYNTLKSNNIEEPIWLTVFGVATQAVIIGVLFELVDILIIHAITSHAAASAAVHIGGTGLVGGAIVVYIVFLIACYFLTKLSWGIAFSVFGKITNKAVIKAVGLCIIAVIVGGIAYHYLTLHRSNSIGSSQPKVNITKQELGSTVYTDPKTGYQITPPAGWTVDHPPGGLTWWHYQNDTIDELRVTTTSPSSGSLQSDVQNWQSTQQTNNSNYKLISSTATTVNGIPAYYITDSWTTKTLKPENITDQVLIEDYNGTEYTVDGNSYTQYASSFSSVLKQSLQSFKP